MIYAPLPYPAVWIETQIAIVAQFVLALLLGTFSEMPARPSKQAPGTPIASAQVSTPIAAPKTVECATCTKLNSAHFDVDFWKGEAALKTDGLDAVRKALEKAGAMRGSLLQRVAELAAERDREHQRAVRAEASYRSLTARLPKELQDQTALVSK
jgi:hypothetical protein